MTFDVRRASLADAVALPPIERSAAQLFRLDPPLAWLADAEVPDAAQHLQAIEQTYVWVAEKSDGQLTGFVRAVDINQQMHIEELSVSQAFQGKGIGRALVAAVIEQARAMRLDSVTLTTFRDLPWNAPFYQRMGFAELTLAQADRHLHEALQSEILHGFPPERRCAMRLRLI
ncbi:Acetyltransferase PA2271 [Pseudomonas sp. IT-347P]|uniref:GNAT family N-acetyltransferase n=1 Tax=Pseudomonas sp. IT-347P TaxID=3026458 RepID=UPI0039DFEA73